MKIPRMSVRRLMVVVLIVALGYWAFQTISRRNRYAARAAAHLRNVQGFRKKIEVCKKAIEIQEANRKVAQDEKDNFDLLMKDRQLLDGLGLGAINEITVERISIGSQRRTHPNTHGWSGWGDITDQREARLRLLLLEKALAREERLAEKFGQGAKRPWRLLEPDFSGPGPGANR